MKPSKKRAAITGKNDNPKPCDGVRIAANVFSNYVLAPAPQLPGESERAEAIHGAALLVFNDEEHERISLRTGFPARIASGSQSRADDEGEPGQRANDKD